METIVVVAAEDPRSPDAAALMDELSNTLESITGRSGRSSFDPADACGPRALFAIARNGDGEAVGCGAIRPLRDDVAEVKRMYAKRKGTGVGGRVLSFLEARAREMGYSALWLETGTVNDKAVSFYETNGYHVIPNFGAYAGRTDSVCFEKNLECFR